MAINKVIYGGNTIMDITDTTATAGKIASGYTAYGANGIKVVGTLEQEVNNLEVGGATVEGTAAIFDEGGGTPSQTQHTIYFEFSDSTDATITAYWDGTFISDAITATTPSSYGQKTVTLAQLDGVTWYEPANIPIGVQLLDYTKVTNDYAIATASGEIEATEWFCVTDYTLIDPSMTFSYSGCYWYYLNFYDSSKSRISTVYMLNDATQDSQDSNIGHGTLTPAKIPSNAMYIRLTGFKTLNSNNTSLIRTA